MTGVFYKFWLWSELLAERVGLHWPFPHFYDWIYRKQAVGLRQLSTALEDSTKALANLNASLDAFHSLMEKEFERACADDPGLVEAVLRAGVTRPSLGWLDLAASRSRRRAGAT